MSGDPVYLEVEPPIGPGWDEQICGRCGDEIDPNDEAVTRPLGTVNGRKMVDTCHTWCAVEDGFRLTWPS